MYVFLEGFVEGQSQLTVIDNDNEIIWKVKYCIKFYIEMELLSTFLLSKFNTKIKMKILSIFMVHNLHYNLNVSIFFILDQWQEATTEELLELY